MYTVFGSSVDNTFRLIAILLDIFEIQGVVGSNNELMGAIFLLVFFLCVMRIYMLILA